MSKQIDKMIQHIEYLDYKLGYVDNNLRYIKVIQALKHWLDKFDSSLSDDERLRYAAIYESYFISGCGFSFYERVCNSILDYKYGNKPF